MLLHQAAVSCPADCGRWATVVDAAAMSRCLREISFLDDFLLAMLHHGRLPSTRASDSAILFILIFPVDNATLSANVGL
jgi:hypothetical protein